jgi:hypothetical protein
MVYVHAETKENKVSVIHEVRQQDLCRYNGIGWVSTA